MRRVLLGAMILWTFANLSWADNPPSPFDKWEKDISAFEAQDKQSPPPKGAVLFVGSSSIRMWKLKNSFPGLAVINRGFGGSRIADSVHFADRLVLKHEPKTIVFYAGDNDIAGKRSPEEVDRDFQAFVKIIHEKLPKTKIVFLGIKPSLARWNLVDTIRQANRLIQSRCEKDDLLTFVDVFPPMLGKDGKPRPELFLKDGLHMTEAGYAIWAKLLLPHLAKPEPAK
jgi:lysophospholipase L1-like esterase